MDYKLLLEKYMAHIGIEEGVDYVSRCSPEDFTADELKELNRMSEAGRSLNEINQANDSATKPLQDVNDRTKAR